MSDTLLLKSVLEDIEKINENSIDIPEGFRLAAPFRPVKCTEDDIKYNIEPVHNFLYFTTDTKKIFLGHRNGINSDVEFLPMCANSGIYYGKKDIYYDKSGQDPDPNVEFSFSDIEGEDIPEIDDLILNIDGCFYRITAIAENSIVTKRLTLRGGGGGSVSGGGDSTTGPHYSLTLSSSKLVYSAAADTLPFSLKANYLAEAENYLKRISLHRGSERTQDLEEEPFYVFEGEYPMGATITLDLTECKKHFSTTNSYYTIITQDLYDTERSADFTVQLVELWLTSIKDNILYKIYDPEQEGTTPEYRFSCGIEGATSATRELICKLYHESDLSQMIGAPQHFAVERNATGEIVNSIALKDIASPDNGWNGHGVFVLKVQATAKLSTMRQPLYSNELTYKLAVYNTEVGAPLLAIYLPTTKEQYLDLPLDYRIVYPDTDSSHELDILLNGEHLKSLTTQVNNSGFYNLYFEKAGRYVVKCNVPTLGITYDETIDILPYSGNIPVINTADPSLMLYLDPRGKSNDEVTRNKWANKGYKKHNNKILEAQLTDMHYGDFDGWLTGENGIPYLQLASGSKLTMPDFRPFQYDPTRKHSTEDDMGFGMTIELDFEINGITDYTTSIIDCVSWNGTRRGVGFNITGNHVQLYNDRANGQINSAGKMVAPLLGQTLVENKRTRLSFVIEKQSTDWPMAYVYLDGILSGAVIYDKTDQFKDLGAPATLMINSAAASVKIYSIRFYSVALGHQMIVNNYIASLPTLAEKQIRFARNNVFSGNKILYDNVADVTYDLQVPYMTITGGWKTEEKTNKWQLLEAGTAASHTNNPGLPTGKKDYRLIDVEVKYPKNVSMFADYKNYSFTNKFSDSKPMAEQYGQQPINGGAIMYAQGTSSMEYPVKNLRLRFKKEQDWFTVRPDIADVEIICMKADYMESSGSHNTGAANLVDDLYAKAGLATPGQVHFNNTGDNKTIVTCIKGHPCLIFYRPDANSTYEYIGKYNLNLDKATPEPFGFMHDETEFGYLKVGDTYPDSETGESITVTEPKTVNSIHCFEFLDNAVEVCNFMNKAKGYLRDEKGDIVYDEEGMPIPDASGLYTYEETWYKEFKNTSNKMVPGWMLGFESRYPEDKEGSHDADMLYPLASWINELYNMEDQEAAVQRFGKEYQRYLNKDFLITYYLVSEALLMADSRVKNMMIATWGKEYRYLTTSGVVVVDKPANESDIQATYYEYIWYPIFYDMDTMLGLDNTGKYRFDYYETDEDPTVYNGKEILWNYVRDALSSELPVYFNLLEDSLYEPVILQYISTRQALMANEAFYNGDADYKYLVPARTGYQDDLNSKYISPGVAPYLYAAQGSRESMREYWVTNRMKYLRGKYTSTKFRNGDRAEFRWYAPVVPSTQPSPNANTTAEKLALSAWHVRPSGDFKFKAAKTGYAGAALGANAGDSAIVLPFTENQEREFTIPGASENANGTEAYLMGLSILSDLGDLSTKYMQKFLLGSQDLRLTRLILGNSNRYYYNPYWAEKDAAGNSASISLRAAYYLQHFNLQNCETFSNTLDFSDCSAIETILLTGSSVNGLTLPPSGILRELRLPETINKLSIHNQPLLDKFSLGGYDYDAAGTDTIENDAYYVNNYSELTGVSISGTKIDTYPMIQQIQNDRQFQYYLPDIAWNITENDTQVFDDATYTMITTDGAGVKHLTCIPALEKLRLKGIPSKTDLAESSTSQASLKGTIYVDIPGVRVNEYAIYQKYAIDFPDVQITYNTKSMTVTSAFNVFLYSQEDWNADLAPWQSLKHDGNATWETLVNFLNGRVPIKPNTPQYDYSFANKWKDVVSGKVYDMTDASTLSETLPRNNNSTVLYLVPDYDKEVHKYTITFFDDNRAQLMSYELDYNDQTPLSTLLADAPLYYQHKQYDGADEHGRYTLKGWLVKQDYELGLDTVVDLDDEYPITNKFYYAYYEEENARQVATDIRCFNIVKRSADVVHGPLSGDGVSSYPGYYISLKSQYATLMQDTITLPSYYTNKGVTEPIIGVGDSRGEGAMFAPEPNDSQLITMGFVPDINPKVDSTAFKRIYFLSDSQYKVIHKGAFVGCQSLEAIELPQGIQELRSQSFQACSNLCAINLVDSIVFVGAYCFGRGNGSWSNMSLEIDKLPANLQYLCTGAFYGGGSGITIAALPSGVVNLPAFVFSGCPSVFIADFSSLQSITTQSLMGAGANITGEVTITIGPALSQLELSAFQDVPAFTGYCPLASHFIVNAPFENSQSIKAKKDTVEWASQYPEDWFDLANREKEKFGWATYSTFKMGGL